MRTPADGGHRSELGGRVLYRQLGSTDIMMPEIGFGCGNTAGLMIWGEPQDRLRAAQQAMELGINYFDTAATYGAGKSEENLGPVLAQLSTRPLVGSKVALQADELDDIAGGIRKSVERSLQRLGLEYLDVVHLHNRVTSHRAPGEVLAIGPLLTVDEMLGPNGVQETFEALQREGKLRYFGFCAFGGDVEAYNQVVDEGRFHSLLVFYNVLNPTSGRAMPKEFAQHDYGQVIDRAASKGIGTVALRVLEAGALSGSATPHDLNRGGPSAEPEYAQHARRALTLDFMRRGASETLPQMAIRFALQKSGVSTVLVGFSEQAQIPEAAACSGGEGFSAEQMGRLEELYRNDFGLA
ncbi:MAG: aldo/keto reductase [Dehalococcoidia bacterium]